MLLVKTKIGPSTIAGTGIFADEFIPADTVVWQFIPGKDDAYTRKQVEGLPEPKRSEILSLYHSYISKQTGRYVWHGDSAGYFNHSDHPNLRTEYREGVEEDLNIAARDIHPGEEITQDYTIFAQEGLDFKPSLT